MSTWKPLQMPTTAPPSSAKLRDGGHDRRESGDGAGAEIVAVGEPAGNDDRVDVAEGGVAVPETTASAPTTADGLDGVELAVRTRELHDPDRWRSCRLPLGHGDPGVLDHRDW